MALRRSDGDVGQTALSEFNPAHAPGDRAPTSGTYSCLYCTFEVDATEGEELPSCDHANRFRGVQYRGLPVDWRLLGSARRR